MEKIQAPFTADQVQALNKYQEAGNFHPFTCPGPDTFSECLGPYNETKNGILIATEQGWICPCGKYTQDWAHAFMAEDHGKE